MINKIKTFFVSVWECKNKLLLWLWNDVVCESIYKRVKRTLVCFDQLLNVVIFNGYEDETLSARFYRWTEKGGTLWKLPALVVDAVFFFDYIYDASGKKIKHCEKSFIREANRHGFPDDYKTKE